MKVAYYSPLPPSRSGIADYSTLLLPALREHVEIVLPRRRAAESDVALYHVGNDAEAHGWIVDALRKRPGVVVLHEYVLHHLVVGLTFARGDAAGYRAAMEREAGLVGYLLAHAVLDNKIPPLWETRPQDFPLAGEILDSATGLIVHSRFVEEHARAAGYSGPVWRIPHPAWPDPAAEPADLGGDPLYGCFGNLNDAKRIPELLRAFARVRERRPGARLLLVGSASRLLEGRFDGEEGVIRREYVDEATLWSLMAACDVHVSLRWPTMGETSGSAIRALTLGKPLVVSDVGWFSELPDDVALKVGEVDEIAAALELLATEPELRKRMGEAARRLAETEHRADRVAELYAAALEEAAGGVAVREAVQREVVTAAAEVGYEDTAELADRLREVGLGG